MQYIIYILLAISMGALFAIYIPMNTQAAKILGSSLAANISFFSIALLTTVVIFLASGQFEHIGRFKHLPPYLLVIGVLSALIIWGMTFLIPELGVRKLFVLTVVGQVIMAVIIGHFGLLSVPHDPISITKVLGVVLVIMGVILSTI